MVPRRRLELPRHFCHRYLKPARLPIPPPGLGARCVGGCLMIRPGGVNSFFPTPSFFCRIAGFHPIAGSRGNAVPRLAAVHSL
ncbi:protein of unknown function [Azospirillum lipoferum 4B]|uniref:Uncharacterized protein n=1 Tax=Azospirillum lipoferum (strain 4B) TaxID=862719 RepID=G7Z3Q4_AZOL4|nr:protein of unknown function [Azospirillum lipoferum 4B]